MNADQVSTEIKALMPMQLTPAMIEAIRNDPLTSVEDRDQWHIRLGWLVCVYEVLLRNR